MVSGPAAEGQTLNFFAVPAGVGGECWFVAAVRGTAQGTGRAGRLWVREGACVRLGGTVQASHGTVPLEVAARASRGRGGSPPACALRVDRPGDARRPCGAPVAARLRRARARRRLLRRRSPGRRGRTVLRRRLRLVGRRGCAPSGRLSVAVALEVVGSRAELRGLVLKVQQLALVDRQAPAADARREPAPQPLERGDPPVEVVAPGAREPFPVAPRRGATAGSVSSAARMRSSGMPAARPAWMSAIRRRTARS